MTPQQATAQLVNQIIQQNRRGLSVEQLLKKMLTRSKQENTMLYLGSGRSLREYINGLESEGVVEVYMAGQHMMIRPVLGARKRPRSASRMPVRKVA